MPLPGLDGTKGLQAYRLPEGDRRSTTRRGRKSRAEWEAWVREALSNLDDPIALGRSPLARLTFVGQVAQERYRLSVAARGRALRDILRACLQAVGKEIDQAPLGKLIECLTAGRSQRELARELGISEEHLSRTYKARLVRLVTEKLRLVSSLGDRGSDRQ